MADKELKDWCKTCDVEPPAMKFKCPECEHNPDNEQIIIDGVNIIGTIDEWARLVAHEWGTNEYSDAEIVKNYILDINKQLARKTQECEELSNKIKNEIQNTVEMERLAKSYGQDLMIYKQNKDIEINSLKDDVIFYLKLIKKIEIYCDEQNLKYDTTACEILNIINKAKGEEDKQ